MFAPLFTIACLTADPSLADVIDDPRTIWYDRESLPEVMVGRSGLYPVGYNLAGKIDKTGSANNEAPWRDAGGVSNCGPEVTAKRLLWIPPGSKIKVRRVRNARIGDKFEGRFPVGTVSAELLYERGRLFEVRSRRKTSNGWDTGQFEYGSKPAGYVTVSNCVDCHADIGRHSLEIDGKRDWYAYVRGLESGGPIHWHPWKAEMPAGWPYGPGPVVIRESAKSFVEWER